MSRALLWMGAACTVTATLVCGLGCDEAQRKRELTAATKASGGASASASPEKPPEPEKQRARTVLGRFKKPKGLAVDASAVYVMDAVAGDKEQNEFLDLLRVPLSTPSPEPVRLATKLRSAGTPLAIQGELLFAIGGDKPNGAGDRLVKINGAAAPGATPAQVAPKALALADPAVATDGTHFFFLAVGPDATPPKAGVAEEKPKLDVMRVPVAGGKPTKIASADRSARLLFVAADAKYVYWPEAGRIMKAPATGGTPSEVAKVIYAWAAVSDGTYLYWSDSPGDNMGMIRRVKVDGGAAETLASGFSFPVGLALDDKSVFFVNHDAEDGGVYRVPKAGGTAVTLIKGQKHPKRIAVDPRHVYWINVGEGALLQMDK